MAFTSIVGYVKHFTDCVELCAVHHITSHTPPRTSLDYYTFWWQPIMVKCKGQTFTQSIKLVSLHELQLLIYVFRSVMVWDASYSHWMVTFMFLCESQIQLYHIYTILIMRFCIYAFLTIRHIQHKHGSFCTLCSLRLIS